MDKPDLPPANLEAEESVLGSLFCNPGHALPLVGRLLRDTDFLHEPNRLVYRAILALWEERQTTDVTLLTEVMRGRDLDLAGGPARLVHLAVAVPTTVNLEYYVEDMRTASELRRIWNGCRQVVAEACVPRVDPAELAATLSRLLSDLTMSRPVESLTMAQHVDLALDRYERASDHRNERPAGVLTTGLSALDEWVAVCPGDLVVIAAETSGGKTALAMQLAAHAAIEQQAQALILSYEMTAAQLTDRLIAHRTRVPAFKLRSGLISEAEYGKMEGMLPGLKAAGIHLRDGIGHWTIDDIGAEARAVKARHGLGLLVVDYLQITAPRRGFNNREREVADISRGLKALGTELGVPVLALSQLNEDGKLRESRAVSHDANCILVIKDDSKGREDWRCITVAKNRDGARDKDVEVYWNGPLMKFSGTHA